jgi:SH3-like domain-containing protein
LLLWTPAQAEPSGGQSSGLPIPRFVSLKTDRVNVRGGPNKDHQVTWIYMRSGLPVEITAEFDNWRRIRDWEGAEGWVYHTLLSGRRTAMVTSPAKPDDALLELRDSADEHAPVTARLQPGVLAMVKNCNGSWCRLIGRGFDGWIQQVRLWGVYPSEKVE